MSVQSEESREGRGEGEQNTDTENQFWIKLLHKIEAKALRHGTDIVKIWIMILEIILKPKQL